MKERQRARPGGVVHQNGGIVARVDPPGAAQLFHFVGRQPPRRGAVTTDPFGIRLRLWCGCNPRVRPLELDDAQLRGIGPYPVEQEDGPGELKLIGQAIRSPDDDFVFVAQPCRVHQQADIGIGIERELHAVAAAIDGIEESFTGRAPEVEIVRSRRRTPASGSSPISSRRSRNKRSV